MNVVDQRYPGVTQIGTELALPFVRDYAKRYNLEVNLDGVENVEWVGAFYKGGLRCVGGILDISYAFPTWRYVYGYYTDGTAASVPAAHAIGKAMVRLPWGLVGAVCVRNLSMLRVVRRHGFTVTVPEDTNDPYVYVERPPKLEVLQAMRQHLPTWGEAVA